MLCRNPASQPVSSTVLLSSDATVRRQDAYAFVGRGGGPIWLWIIPLWFRLWFPPVMLNLRRQDVEPGHAGTGHHAVCRQSCGIAFAGMVAAEHAEQFRQLLALVGRESHGHASPSTSIAAA
jgi:hypothetical protein